MWRPVWGQYAIYAGKRPRISRLAVAAEPRRRAMAYCHAERNLALIRQLEAETEQLLGSLAQLDAEKSAWLEEATRAGKQAVPPRTGHSATAVPVPGAPAPRH